MTDLLTVPSSRAAGLREVAARLLAARRVVTTTHVQADGDGAGSQAAVAAWLARRGIACTIVNPTPFPDAFRFLVSAGTVADLGTPEADAAIAEADLFLVLDTSEPRRVGGVAPHLPPERTVVVDHHPAGPEMVGDLAVQDPEAAATGEMVFDLVTLAGDAVGRDVALGAYVALVSDTGSFRFANTTPRVHAVVAQLMATGLDPEWVYRRLFATAPLRRLELLREALGTLRVADDAPVGWMTVTHDAVRRHQAGPEDFEGLVEHVRSVEGIEVALIFRETSPGETKVSLRSNGDVDVNAVARRFGGGGHVKAAGATIASPASEAAPRVVDAVREALRGG